MSHTFGLAEILCNNKDLRDAESNIPNQSATANLSKVAAADTVSLAESKKTLKLAKSKNRYAFSPTLD